MKGCEFLDMAVNFAIKRNEDETAESLLDRFKRENKKSGVIQQYRDREFFLSKSQKRQRKSDRHKAMLQMKRKKNRRS